MQLSRSILDRIAEQVGCSFYLLDTKRFRSNYEALLESFQAFYPKTNIAYSYKTNYIPQLCGLVHDLGGFAEVVSEMEYELAKKVGVPGDRTFFNGPCKTFKAVEGVLLSGGVVNADSMADLQLILELARQHASRRLRIGLRCNFEVGDGVLSRFGFDVRTGALDAAKRLIGESQNVELVALHCHFATRTLDTWTNRTKGMLHLIREHFRDYSRSLSFVSLGGGLYGPMPRSLRSQFEVPIPNFSDYATVSAKPFADFFAGTQQEDRPTLIIEPGTALAADSMRFAANVVDIRRVGEKTIATIGGSIYNINPTPNRKNMPITVYPRNDGTQRDKYTNVDLAGYTCIESDYLYRSFDGALTVGDYIVFEDVGAYSVVMKPPFIVPNFAIVEYDSDGGAIRVIKRKEEFDDIFRTYSF